MERHVLFHRLGSSNTGKKMVFPDFSVEVQKKRAHFTEAKRQLQIRHISYTMLFLARLLIVGEDKAYFFDTSGCCFCLAGGSGCTRPGPHVIDKLKFESFVVIDLRDASKENVLDR